MLYYNPFLMEHHTTELHREGWRCTEIYSGTNGTAEEFYDHVSMTPGFPSHFGRNLDALRDSIRDLPFPDSGRHALMLTCFEHLTHRDMNFAKSVLDVFASAEREFLLAGKRVLFLVQSNDPQLSFLQVGASSVTWNFEEFLVASRKAKNA